MLLNLSTMEQGYVEFIADLKQRIVQSRYIAAGLANKEQLLLYFKTGEILTKKTEAQQWGAKVLERIAEDLQKQLPGLRGFSARNLWLMKKFYFEYQCVAILQSVTAEIREVRSNDPAEQFWAISFTHHVLLLNRCKTNEERFFYIRQAATQFWSTRLLEHHISANLYLHQGNLPNNFSSTLPKELKPSALEVFQDEYLMDFISTSESEDERVFEEKVVGDIKNFILRMSKGFCFIGNQYGLEVGGEEFFVDLLFFNRHLRSMVAFEYDCRREMLPLALFFARRRTILSSSLR
jgi:predicted nuclease of restriction endonuclease-like (RecB) superfamily